MNPKKKKAEEAIVAKAGRNDVGSARSNDNAVCADLDPGLGVKYLNSS
jgi:hypothetical protein